MMRRLLIVVVVAAVYAALVAACDYEITEHTKMDGSLPSRNVESVRRTSRSELVGHWKSSLRESWPDVDYAMELGSSGRGFGTRVDRQTSIMNSLLGSWKWSYSNGYLKLTTNDGSREFFTPEIHRVSRNTMCMVFDGKCEIVIQRVSG